MAYSGEKFSLKWNDFHKNIIESYSELQATNDFSDVTLIGEDNQQIEAHRVILSSSSPLFNSIFQRNKQSHPIIYMRGVKANELAAIVNFIYQGEANIFQEDLKNFLALAEELQLKGLTADLNAEERKKLKPDNNEPKEEIFKNGLKSPPKTVLKDEIKSKIVVNEDPSKNQFMTEKNSVASIDDTNELTMQIRSLMRKEGGKTGWVCQVCGKTAQKSNIAQHIESNHMEGVSHTCTLCGKISKSADGLRQHRSKEHKD